MAKDKMKSEDAVPQADTQAHTEMAEREGQQGEQAHRISMAGLFSACAWRPRAKEKPRQCGGASVQFVGKQTQTDYWAAPAVTALQPSTAARQAPGRKGPPTVLRIPFSSLPDPCWHGARQGQWHQSGKAIGRPRPSRKVEQQIRDSLIAGVGMLKVASKLGVGSGTVQQIKGLSLDN